MSTKTRFAVATILLVSSCELAIGQDSASAVNGIAQIRKIASGSKCAAHNWRNRGRAPRSYIEGMASSFARAICHPDLANVKVVSSPADLSASGNDALAVYDAIFNSLGMRNDKPGVDTLRHSYTLLIGLGMMESSGRYCEGRDVSQCFVKAENAEAGLFQTSYGARRVSPVLEQLFVGYSADTRGCLADVFKGNITCGIVRSHNPKCPTATSDIAGNGPGADWQRLTKSCPAFAAEYGAVVLRKNGGSHGEFNPIRKKQAEVRPECDSMLGAVEAFVGQHHEICSAL